MNWGAFRRGQVVRFYTGSGWKKGEVVQVNSNSCCVTWATGSTRKLTTVYDTRNIKPQ